MLRLRLRASRLSAACVSGVTVNEMWTRATRPMKGRPPFFFPVLDFAGPVFLRALKRVPRAAGCFFFLIAIAYAISDTKPGFLFIASRSTLGEH